MESVESLHEKLNSICVRCLISHAVSPAYTAICLIHSKALWLVVNVRYISPSSASIYWMMDLKQAFHIRIVHSLTTCCH